MKWIDIKEKKPNVAQMCKVKFEVWRYHTLWYKDEGVFKYEKSPALEEGYFDDWYEDCSINVTHWKPL